MCAILAHVFGKLLSRDQSSGTPDMPISDTIFVSGPTEPCLLDWKRPGGKSIE
jgi:hypothetical protein